MDTNYDTYVLHIEHNAFSPKSTVETILDNTKLTIGEGKFVLDGSNDQLDVLLTVNAFEVGNFYTQSDFDMESTAVTYKGVEQQLLKADLLLEMGVLESGSIGYYVEFSFINQDTILHTVVMPAPLPAAKDTIDVKCINLDVDESFGPYGIMMLSASNALYDIFVMYPGEYAEAGVYEELSITITYKLTWLTIQSIKATLTLSETADGWSANIEAYCSDYYTEIIDEDGSTIRVKHKAPLSPEYNAHYGDLAPSNDAYIMAEATIYNAILLTENGKHLCFGYCC
jgi:hypothetical protein